MGTSHGDFTKYPRTPHLFGSKGTDDDKHLNEAESKRFVSDESLIVEEKLDGTNVGIHFSEAGEMVLQCRGHLITEGMHPQYDLFKQWAAVKRHVMETQLENRFILFGEWVYCPMMDRTVSLCCHSSISICLIATFSSRFLTEPAWPMYANAAAFSAE